MQRRLVVAVLLGTAGCVPGGQPELVRSGHIRVEGLSAETTLAWTRLPQSPSGDGARQLWSIDGPLLDRLYLAGGLPSGEALVTAPAGRDLPKLRAGMSPSELAELVTDTRAALGATGVTTEELRPIDFAGVGGFRVRYRFVSQTGLEYRSLAAGAQRDGRLYAIIFEAAADHYFAKLEPHVDAMIGSAVVAA